ncbi:hypothetical protein ABTD15_19890, partial [Acinetobacter baumannii]
TGRALADYDVAMGRVHEVRERTAPEYLRALPSEDEAGLPMQSQVLAARRDAGAEGFIRIVNAREHNLKALDVSIPRGR